MNTQVVLTRWSDMPPWGLTEARTYTYTWTDGVWLAYDDGDEPEADTEP